MIDQAVPFWLTPAGCAAVSDHQPDLDGHHCRLCGSHLGRTS